MKTNRTSLACLILIAFFSFSTGWAQTSAESPSLPDGYFPILNWDLPEWADASFANPDNGLSSLAQCGFNTAAFVRPQHLPQVEKLGLKCIFAAQEFPIPWRTLSDQQIFDTVKKMVDEAAGNKAVMGYFLADEPGAPDFPALGKAVAAVKKLAPGKLAYINLFPDYATLGAPDISQLGTTTYADYLEKFISEVHPQFISYDNYQIEYSLDQKNASTLASYYNNLLTVRAISMKHDLPFWNIVSSAQILPQIPPPSPANLLLQAYTTLAAGGKGLTWYTYFGVYPYAPIEKNSSRGPSWSYVKMVNDQIKVLGPIVRPLISTGVYFSPPVLAPSLPLLPGKYVKSIACTAPLMIGEFIGVNSDKYAMIVNLSLTDSARFTLTLNGAAGAIRQFSPVDGSLNPIEPNNALWLTAGQGVLLKLP